MAFRLALALARLCLCPECPHQRFQEQATTETLSKLHHKSTVYSQQPQNSSLILTSQELYCCMRSAAGGNNDVRSSRKVSRVKICAAGERDCRFMGHACRKWSQYTQLAAVAEGRDVHHPPAPCMFTTCCVQDALLK